MRILIVLGINLFINTLLLSEILFRHTQFSNRIFLSVFVRTFAYIKTVTSVISTLGTCFINVLVYTVDTISTLITFTVLTKGLTFLTQALIVNCVESF